jgi:hypothetical protein
MKKYLALLALSLSAVWLTCSPAQATPIDITGGSMGMSQFAHFDTVVQITEPLTTRAVIGGALLPSTLNGTKTVVFTPNQTSPGFNHTLVMTFTFEPLNWSEDVHEDLFGDRRIFERFDMTGFFDGAEIAGVGILKCCTREINFPPYPSPLIDVEFTFHTPLETETLLASHSVPEPLSLTTSILGLGALLLVWRYRSRSHDVRV